ncbi:hypothetical protein COLO4_33882 [Corchorus olitorius]|uniref:Uncharacterized protein n=1 Tax=Corchorus olitorius TaxID=93759 RepID=A0A1R3GQ68_9ROSI|nr:hypothetical protein COLO4_33882 [Corchorus olitorius]
MAQTMNLSFSVNRVIDKRPYCEESSVKIRRGRLAREESNGGECGGRVEKMKIHGGNHGVVEVK